MHNDIGLKNAHNPEPSIDVAWVSKAQHKYTIELKLNTSVTFLRLVIPAIDESHWTTVSQRSARLCRVKCSQGSLLSGRRCARTLNRAWRQWANVISPNDMSTASLDQTDIFKASTNHMHRSYSCNLNVKMCFYTLAIVAVAYNSQRLDCCASLRMYRVYAICWGHNSTHSSLFIAFHRLPFVEDIV